MKQRVAKKEVVVCRTDKSGKLGICSLSAYREMGNTHTVGDKVIGVNEVRDIQKKLNGPKASVFPLLKALILLKINQNNTKLDQ